MLSAGVELQNIPMVPFSYLQACLDIFVTEVGQNYLVFSDISQGVNDGSDEGTQDPETVTLVSRIVTSTEINLATIPGLLLKSSDNLDRMVL